MLGQFKEKLRNMTTETGYRTKQRELVLEYLKKHRHCHTADDIIKALSEQGHAVSKPTVYRTLDRFTVDGTVSRFINSVGESAVYRFNGCSGDHLHMKCLKCNNTICVDCAIFTDMQEHFSKHHAFTVDKTKTIIYGICSDCSET